MEYLIPIVVKAITGLVSERGEMCNWSREFCRIMEGNECFSLPRIM